ncbi:MAG TPA: YMGG-like glycine zipper-containing protein [Acetobacteraceae bacterium]|nr:YMGG-like glycine zipper-containing protein [Acetobacteraceae bacterium]
MPSKHRLMAGGGAAAAALLLAGCAVQPPTGPTVMALPAPGKSLQAFQQDDAACRYFAQQQTAYPAAVAGANNPTANGAVLGTLAGAALGAGLGAVAGNAGAGAAIGGATGLLGGSAIGSNRAAASQYSLQQQYNIAYTQCMYSRGNSVRSPPPGYSFDGGPYYGYPAYPYPYPYASGFFGPSVFIAGGGYWGGGWGRWHDHDGWGWHR